MVAALTPRRNFWGIRWRIHVQGLPRRKRRLCWSCELAPRAGGFVSNAKSGPFILHSFALRFDLIGLTRASAGANHVRHARWSSVLKHAISTPPPLSQGALTLLLLLVN